VSEAQRALKRILYVEDDDPIRAVGVLSLQAVGGFEVVECASGAHAIAAAPTAGADLILMDVMMPAMDGPETLSRLRQIPATAQTPVVFLTAKVQPSEIAQLEALGAAGVLAKPFDPMTLPDRLRALWAQSVRGAKAPS
jgi:two-component system OmpR family response regulator